MLAGGPEGLRTLKEAKLRPAKSDYGPRLFWEAPIWQWFMRLAGGYPLSVDRSAWLQTIERQGWDEGLAWHFLLIIEQTFGEAAQQKQEEDAARARA